MDICALVKGVGLSGGKIHLKKLPGRKDPKYMDVLISNVVEAYRKFLSDGMSLDYCGVVGKTRTLVAGNPEYKRMTRAIRAERFLDEIAEIEDLSEELARSDPGAKTKGFDPYEDAPPQDKQKQYKDWFAMKLKTADMRRDLLKMSKTEDETEAANAMNVFFVALTREEFEAMETVEVHDGDSSAHDALGAKKEESPVVAEAKLVIKEAFENEIVGGYKLNPDESAEDF